MEKTIRQKLKLSAKKITAPIQTTKTRIWMENNTETFWDVVKKFSKQKTVRKPIFSVVPSYNHFKITEVWKNWWKNSKQHLGFRPWMFHQLYSIFIPLPRSSRSFKCFMKCYSSPLNQTSNIVLNQIWSNLLVELPEKFSNLLGSSAATSQGCQTFSMWNIFLSNRYHLCNGNKL